jgi:hypothetical protein
LKKNKAQDCLYLLSSVIDFKNINILLKEIEKEIESKKLEQKVLVKYEESLRSIINGLKKN